MTRPRVELLYLADCPNWQATRELIIQTSRELAIEPDLHLIEIADLQDARRLRFPGSPTVRIDGHDIEPGLGANVEPALSCRLYQTERGTSGRPDPSLLRDALGAADPYGRPHRAHALPRPAQLAYRTLLEHFAAGTPPRAGDLEAAAAAGLEPSELRALLARHDLAHFDENGTPTIAYPFSATPRGHHVLIDGRVRVEAMCAIDALGIAPMLHLPAQISSHDPHTGAAVTVYVEPAAVATWQPAEAVVLSACNGCDGPSYQNCCTLLNFFESTARATAYLNDHPDSRGEPTTIPEAFAQARATFGALLDGLAHAPRACSRP